MAKVRARGVWMLLLVGISVAASLARAEDEPKIARARGVLKHLVEGRFEFFMGAADDTIRAALTPEKLAQLWAGIVFKLGSYQKEESAARQAVGEHESIRIVSRFERGTLAVRITLDRADRVAGFRVEEVRVDDFYEAPSYVEANAWREEKVTVSAGKHPLPGVLALPTRPGPHPGLVLVHGSGPHDADETIGALKPFRDLALGLASRGVAVLRYEKRTRAHPRALPPNEWTLEEETIEDAVAACQLLRGRTEIDPRRILVAGHSLGGMAAPFIAARDGKLAGMVLLAANARSVLDLLEEQTQYLAKLAGPPPEAVRKKLEAIREGIQAIRAGKLEGVTEKLGMPAPYLARLHQTDPVEAAKKLTIPILVVQGGRDYQVTKADFDLWKKHLGGREQVTFKLYEDLNHAFVKGQGPSSPAEYQVRGHVDERVVQDLAEWIRALRTSPARPGG